LDQHRRSSRSETLDDDAECTVEPAAHAFARIA
jgi:hypothetical protein